MSDSLLVVGVIPPHQSVLYNEVLAALKPQSGKRYLDGTLGAGGHALGILDLSSPGGELLGLDLDPDAINIAQGRLEKYSTRVQVHKGSYLDAKNEIAELGWIKVDGIVLDLGVSSMQIDQSQRGFSFQKEGDLDMRFDPTMGRSAADLVNNLEEKELADIIWRYGEERFSRKIASAIVRNRPISQTGQLAEIVRKVVGGSRSRIDPATRTFQALRIAVNKELSTLERALPELTGILEKGGRIAVISFHSLEDRIVKTFFRMESTDCICPPEQPICTCSHKASLRTITPHPIQATAAELASNVRSRSAKLRVAQKIV
jgi:16S rRNA (cytosine1402-N4)-methyltransferase